MDFGMFISCVEGAALVALLVIVLSIYLEGDYIERRK